MRSSAGNPAPPQLWRRWLFTATIFAGSFLLFLIQPMIARTALPRLGGAPAVWNSAMLVYQEALRGVVYFNHAHNHYLQVAAEGGLLLLVPVAYVKFDALERALVGDAAKAWLGRVSAATIGRLRPQH